MKYNFNDVLLIGLASDLRDCSIAGKVTIVCIEDVPVPQEYQSQKNILRLSANADINEVYYVVLSLLQEDEIEREFTERLCQSVLHEDDICTICNVAKEFIQNPIVVLDNSLKHIAESSGTELQDAIWVDQRKNGSYMSADYIQLLAEQAGYKKDHYSMAPVLLPKAKLKCRRIISHIFLSNHPIGTIVIFEVQKNFSELDLKLAKRLAEFLALHMRNNDSLLYSRGVAYEHLFQDLLDERIAPAELAERIQSQNLQLEDNLYVMVFDISEFDRTYKTLQYFRIVLDDIINNGKSILHNNYIVMVIMRNGDDCLAKQEIEKINNFCKSKKLSAGLSKCFHDISMLKAHFEQGINALNLNWKRTKEYRLSSYTEYTIEHIMAIVSQHANLRQFCEESLLKLLEYDTSNNTDFADCLHEFLIQERNIAHTALALHMHRNTLIYRINRIQEIMNHDLEDHDFRFRLLLSFRILEFTKQ